MDIEKVSFELSPMRMTLSANAIARRSNGSFIISALRVSRASHRYGIFHNRAFFLFSGCLMFSAAQLLHVLLFLPDPRYFSNCNHHEAGYAR
jgi:hypothetical protein